MAKRKILEIGEKYLTKSEAQNTYQPQGEYLTESNAANTYQQKGNYLTASSVETSRYNFTGTNGIDGVVIYRKWHKMVICDINIDSVDKNHRDARHITDGIIIMSIPDDFALNNSYMPSFECNSPFFTTNNDNKGVLCAGIYVDGSDIIAIKSPSLTSDENIKGQLMWFTN